jgi:hypothetical protein
MMPRARCAAASAASSRRAAACRQRSHSNGCVCPSSSPPAPAPYTCPLHAQTHTSCLHSSCHHCTYLAFIEALHEGVTVGAQLAVGAPHPLAQVQPKCAIHGRLLGGHPSCRLTQADAFVDHRQRLPRVAHLACRPSRQTGRQIKAGSRVRQVSCSAAVNFAPGPRVAASAHPGQMCSRGQQPGRCAAG